MGKGTKKKTVWRTFSFENGYTNDTDADTTAHQQHQQNGSNNNHDVSNRSSNNNGKFMGSWRSQRYDDDSTNSENEPHSEYLNSNGNVNGFIENGHDAFFKRQPLIDKYASHEIGLQKSTSYLQENGNKSDFPDIHANHTTKRLNHSSKVPVSRHGNHQKWDTRNGNSNYNSNGTFSNYSRGFRKSPFFAYSDEKVSNECTINNTDEHFNENGLAKNARNADDSDKCQDKANGGSSVHRSLQLNKFNEDEYTRISTPRSEVLFKKGYLMRNKKYVGTTNTTAASSNDSGSVSVVSNEETASYYSIQSMSPDNSTYLNGNSSSDSNSATYPNDRFEHDLSLMYSSGFYDNSGYFYVNPYIQNNFDQINGSTILMPYGSAPANDIDGFDADVYPAPMSPVIGDAGSIDGEHANNYNSINSEEMSSSSLSENVSIDNDPDTPPSPLTPPPSPLSINENPIARVNSETTVNEESTTEPQDAAENENETDTQNAQNITGALTDDKGDMPEGELEMNADADANAADNYSMPYYSPFIFVPPFPFVPDGRLPNSRRGKFRRHAGRRYNHFSHHYNRLYIPSNWSEAPEEMAQNTTNGDNDVETKTGDEISVYNTPTPTIEQCDKILKNSKLNLNVSEFIPQSKRMIFVPIRITPSPPASIYFVPIPSTESTLNVNVPEFLPKNYKPLHETYPDENENGNDTDLTVNEVQTPMATINTNDKMTITTNESANKNQNETTIIKNGLSNDTKCTTQPALNGLHASNANDSSNAKNEIYVAKPNTTKRNGEVAVSNMSDLLKNNSDNLNLDASSFNIENSHTNLKADLGIKKITNNISKNKIYKNDNYCNYSGSNNRSYKINNSNKNAKTRHAYPKTKETPIPYAWESLPSRKSVKRDDVESSQSTVQAAVNAEEENIQEKTDEKPGLTYAQMVVPTKSSPHPIQAPPTNEVKNNVKIVREGSKSPKSPSPRGRTTQNVSNVNGRHAKPRYKKNVAKEKGNEQPVKPAEGSIEWFTIGAKGKMHVASNDSTALAEIAFENESKQDKVSKIAEELQLDINNDTDLAMDIMDSLPITDQKSDKMAAKFQKKKKTATNLGKQKKKFTKDKPNKDQKQSRRDTFDIIEPCFSTQNTDETPAEHESDDDKFNNIESEDSEQLVENFVFDVNIFATPCNLQMELKQSSSNGNKLCNSLRMSNGNTARNLFNQFDIYQQNYTSVETQQLKQEEEMVIKVLEQLNKSIDEKEMPQNDENLDAINDNDDEAPLSTQTEPTDEEMPASENSLERFSINAKPYQNIYSSNHFLEHSFGDRNDKSDQVVTSTDLSSSDQSHVEDYEDITGNLDTYPVIDADDNTAPDTEIENEKDSIECDPETIESNSKNEIQIEINSKVENQCNPNDGDHKIENHCEQKSDAELEPKIEELRIQNEIDTQVEQISDEKNEQTLQEEAFEVTDNEDIQINPLNELVKVNDEPNESNNDEINESISLEVQETASDGKCEPNIQIEVTPPDKPNEQKDNETDTEPISLGTETCSIETDIREMITSTACNQSIKSNSSTGSRPWLRIVDTTMLAQQKKLQQTFPITTAVSMWLNQAQKEKTPEPIFRLPDYRFFSTATKYKKQGSQTSHSNSSIDLTEDTASVNSDKFHINDDEEEEEEEDIMNFWESPALLTPQTPTPPPIYNSVYGNSINYTNLLSNKNELLCNNIIEFDAASGNVSDKQEMPHTDLNKSGLNQNTDATETTGIDEKCYRPPPEVCCNIM